MQREGRGNLVERRADILSREPRLRARDLASRLGISEAELLAIGTPTSHVTPLAANWPGIIADVSKLGYVMALTRNESVVHERKGVYGKLEGGAHVGLIVGDDIDLRIFFSRWRFGFAVVETGEESVKRSLQFFDAQGVAVHKIYLTDQSDVQAFDRLVSEHQSLELIAVETVPPAAAPVVLPDAEIDVAGFRLAWDGLKDTHEFHGLLNKFKLQRLQAMRLAGHRRAQRVAPAALRDALTEASKTDLPIMVFVGNHGMIQIHTGPVTHLKAMGPWYNVLDDRFNLHLREDHIGSVWVVRKPTDDGVVTSLEVFDAQGELMVTLFGKRKPGMKEDAGWRAVVEGVAEREVA
ncbi:MAG: hemin-degrading factor [Rhizobiales bacterium]|nr:hemin-degrading factor [Hyphomicrobiales bacterium]